MAAILDALSPENQALVWERRVAIEGALDRGKFELAYALLVSTVVPPELEETKEALISLFPKD